MLVFSLTSYRWVYEFVCLGTDLIRVLKVDKTTFPAGDHDGWSEVTPNYVGWTGLPFLPSPPVLFSYGTIPVMERKTGYFMFLPLFF